MIAALENWGTIASVETTTCLSNDDHVAPATWDFGARDPWRPKPRGRATGVLAGKLAAPRELRSSAGGPVAYFAKPARPPRGHQPRMRRPHQRGQGPA